MLESDKLSVGVVLEDTEADIDIELMDVSDALVEADCVPESELEALYD